MSDNNLALLDLDLTGFNPANLISNEAQSLTRKKNVAITTLNGPFYSSSLKIIHTATNYELRKNIDYKILQPLETLSVLTGKQVAGAILIHNAVVHQNLSVTYQAVGGEFSTDSAALVEYLNQLSGEEVGFSWYNILIEESESIKELEKLDRFDFHFLCYGLEKIRNAILWSDSEYYERIRSYLERILDSIEQQTKLSLDSFLDQAFGTFKSDINKSLIGLSLVENLELANQNDIDKVVEYENTIVNFEKNKYIALNSLQAFKDKVYERFASAVDTNIGLNRGVVINPNMLNLINMLNGSVFILESKNYYEEKFIAYDDRVFPPNTEKKDRYTVLRINNNMDNKGGLFLYSERSSKNIFLSYHPNGDTDSDFIWSELGTETSTEKLSKEISTHILRIDNPHQESKLKVGLGNVENLPVVEQSDILCLKSCRKYMTMDAFLLFFKTYLVGTEAAAQDPRNDDVEKVQIIYTAQAEPKCLPAPCPCPEPEPSPEPPPPAPTPFPLMVKISQQYTP
jgi:hypothetical protein